jgi:signal-transduction protein with cAMP-binding, CBS, and nucleotidyltransferase domain
VITAHDIVMRVLAKQRMPALTRIDEVMSTPPLFVFSSAPVDLACEIMGDEGVSRLLVLDAAGHVQGVITLTDVLRNTADDLALTTVRRTLATRTTFPPASTTAPAATDSPDAWTSEPEQRVTNSARVEAELVLRGGTNQFKEFP